ncbi:MAG: acyl carrier protein [Spirochaetes bacterium]|nr:MAG: acyl carrier protein [Spirochaetota bacterium]
MTHLVERLLNSNPTKPARGLQEKFKSFYWKTNLFWYQLQEGYKGDFSEKHPVDYLYEEFKKLPIKYDKVTKLVFQHIEEVIGKGRKERTLNSKLFELGLDDLDKLELIMDLEKELGIVIPDDDVETKIFKKGNTIQTLVDYLKGKL